MKTLFTLWVGMASFASVFAQNTDLLTRHQEVMNHPYVEVDRSTMLRSPAYNLDVDGIMTRQVNVDANGNNIVGDAANEPSIAIDPTNPNRMVIGWRQFNTITSDFRQAGYGYSTDGGETWTFPGVLDPGVFRSDPVLDFDAEGNFYYNSLTVDTATSSDFNCAVFKSTDGGANWGVPVPARGGDKAWMAIDKTNGIGAGHIYSQWNFAFSECQNENFTRSINGGDSFEDCSVVPNFPLFGTLAVDGEGDLYQAGFQFGYMVQKSTTAKDPNSQVTWEDPFVSVPLGGSLPGSGPNPGGLLGQIWVDTDNSTGPHAGNVYVLATVENNALGDPADVMFSKSTDGGQTFSQGFRLNTDLGNEAYQWFGTLSVAPNGRIDVVWLDTRDDPVNHSISVLYYCFSEDGGDTWSPNTPISQPFDPKIGYPIQEKIGDYYDMVSDNEFAHLAWANTFTGGQDVYYTRISPGNILNVAENPSFDQTLRMYPNPVVGKSLITFQLNETMDVKLEVFDIYGKRVSKLLDGQANLTTTVPWSGTDKDGNPLASGVYFIRLTSSQGQYSIKAIVK